MPDNDRLMTLEDVADYCNVPEMIVHRWINKRKLIVCFLGNGEHRFRLIDVRAAFETHKKAHGSTTYMLAGIKQKKFKRDPLK